MELRYRVGDAVRTVRVTRGPGASLSVAVDGRAHDVTVRRAEACAGALDLVIDGRPVRAFAAEDGKRRFVKVGPADPVAFARAETHRAAERAGAGSGAGAGASEALAANMHGQVVAVLAKEGDRVEAGATLVILEAMKMELRIVAPHAGRVKLVACKPGERGRDRVT